MLVSFSVGNFLSFDEEQEFTMVASDSKVHPNHIIDRDGLRLLRFSAIYGANASGKSNLIKAIDYSRQILFNPSDDDMAKRGFAGDVRHRNPSGNRSEGPSHFQYTLLLEDDPRIFIIGFDFDTEKRLIESEWLVAKNGNEDDIIYNIDYTDMSQSYSAHECIQKIIDKSGGNNHAEYGTMLLTILDYGYDNPEDECNEFTELLCEVIAELLLINVHTSIDTDFHIPISLNELDILVKELNRYDTGITGYRLQPMIERYDWDYSEFCLVSDVAEMGGTGDPPAIHLTQGVRPNHPVDNHLSLVFASGSLFLYYKPSKVYCPEGYAEVQFLHSFGINSVPYRNESEGTKRLIRLLCSLHGMRGFSGTMVVDEMECNIHPLAVNKFLRDFIDNPEYREIQLMITTHDSRLLNYDIMRRDEIWFSESENKQHNRFTELYSLQSFVDDSGTNIDVAYLEGRFGAIPIFDELPEEAGEDAY